MQANCSHALKEGYRKGKIPYGIREDYCSGVRQRCDAALVSQGLYLENKRREEKTQAKCCRCGAPPEKKYASVPLKKEKIP